MRWHYNLIAQGSGPLYRDLVSYSASTIEAGSPVVLINAGEDSPAVQRPAGVAVDDFIGVTAETGATAYVPESGTLVFTKCMINPDAIYLAQYDTGASAVDASTATMTTITTVDDSCDGSWLYCRTGTGIGQLAFIGVCGTTEMTLDTTDPWGITPIAGDTTVSVIRNVWHPHLDLEITGYQNVDGSGGTVTGQVRILENYIEAANVPFGPMRPRQHHMLNNLNSAGVRFYSDIYFFDSIWLSDIY